MRSAPGRIIKARVAGQRFAPNTRAADTGHAESPAHVAVAATVSKESERSTGSGDSERDRDGSTPGIVPAIRDGAPVLVDFGEVPRNEHEPEEDRQEHPAGSAEEDARTARRHSRV